MFDIQFISDLENGNYEGKITLGDFSETFEADSGYWKRDQYLQQWLEARKRLLEGKNSAFITDMRDPTIANYIVWWPAYVQGSEVIFHNQILFLKELKKAFSENNVFASIEPYRQQAEGWDTKLSEWMVPISAMKI